MWTILQSPRLSLNIYEASSIQSSVDEFTRKSTANKFQLNEEKCKELQITFARPGRTFTSVFVKNMLIEVVPSGHANYERMEYPHLRDCEESFNKTLLPLSTKKNKNLYKGFTNILPDPCASCDGMCSSRFPRLLIPNYLCEDLEKLQKRALHIIFPTLPYAEALVEAGVDSLFNRRQILTTKLFNNDIANDESHKIY